jgi:phage terminase small subunit
VNKKLTPKQSLFIQEYLIDKNATQAAIRAGYSKKTAKSIGQENLTKPDIKNAIDSLLAAAAAALDITRERVLREMARCAFADVRKLFNADGSLKDILELDPDTAAAIAGLEIESLFAGKGDARANIGTTNKVKFINKTTALDMLGKHLGLFEKDNKQAGEGAVDALNQILEGAKGKTRGLPNLHQKKLV